MAYNELTIFINQILDQKGLASVDDAVREQLVADLESRLMDQINRGIVEAVPSAKLSEFEELANGTENDTAIQAFLTENKVDTQTIAANTMLRFKELYLGASS